LWFQCSKADVRRQDAAVFSLLAAMNENSQTICLNIIVRNEARR